MYEIVRKTSLNPTVSRMDIKAPCKKTIDFLKIIAYTDFR